MASAERIQQEINEPVRNRAGSLPSAVSATGGSVSHNLNGQKLGRKGRGTRERILAATVELLADVEEAPISLSAVARRTSLGMTSLYNYFTDLTELLLAVLEPVIATAEESYLAMLRRRWPDEDLADCCLEFVQAYHCFWARNTRLLHLRNNMADQNDRRMMQHRIMSSQPIIGLLVQQMDGDPGEPSSPAASMATMVMIGVERSITVATDKRLPEIMGWDIGLAQDRFQEPGARLMEMAIRDIRGRAGQ